MAVRERRTRKASTRRKPLFVLSPEQTRTLKRRVNRGVARIARLPRAKPPKGAEKIRW